LEPLTFEEVQSIISFAAEKRESMGSQESFRDGIDAAPIRARDAKKARADESQDMKAPRVKRRHEQEWVPSNER